MEKGMTAAIAPLAQVLADELSPAGVEAKLSAVQAEAHTRVAIARTEREQAFEQVRLAREATGHARREREAMAQQVEEANAERDVALADAETAREQALAALHEAASTERLARHAEQEATRRAERAEAARDAAIQEMTEKVEAAETETRQAQAQAVQNRQQAEQAQTERDQARSAAKADRDARAEAERAAAAAAARAQAAEAERDRALARADAEAHARGQALAETAEARARAARVDKQAAELEKRTARQLAKAEERATEKISEAQDRAAAKWPRRMPSVTAHGCSWQWNRCGCLTCANRWRCCAPKPPGSKNARSPRSCGQRRSPTVPEVKKQRNDDRGFRRPGASRLARLVARERGESERRRLWQALQPWRRSSPAGPGVAGRTRIAGGPPSPGSPRTPRVAAAHSSRESTGPSRESTGARSGRLALRPSPVDLPRMRR
ncbi:hypothetical protein ACFQX6_12005 [Streptosporangium lutulentum]